MPTDFQIEHSPTESTICPYCHAPIPHEDRAMRCAECDSVYHDGCWAELDKCGQFGCECMDAHAVSYGAIAGYENQSQWLPIPNEIDKAGSFVELQNTEDPLRQVTAQETILMLKKIILTPSEALLIAKSFGEARAFWHKKRRRYMFDLTMFSLIIFTVLAIAMFIGAILSIPYLRVEIANGEFEDVFGIAFGLLVFGFLPCLGWIQMLAGADRLRDKNRNPYE